MSLALFVSSTAGLVALGVALERVGSGKEVEGHDDDDEPPARDSRKQGRNGGRARQQMRGAARRGGGHDFDKVAVKEEDGEEDG